MKRWTLSLGLMLAAAPAMAQRAPASSWVRSATLYEVFVRDFSPGGNLAGVTAGLGRIQSTGANCIWIMPIQPVSMLNHMDRSDRRTRCTTTARSTRLSAPPPTSRRWCGRRTRAG